MSFTPIAITHVYDPTDDPTSDKTNVQEAMIDHAQSIEQRVASMSGVVAGGIMTLADPATFDISDGNGEIFDSYTEPGNTSIIEFTWSGLTGIPLTIVGTAGSTDIFLNSSGAVVEVTDPPTGASFREMVYLGTIYHSSGIITDIANAPAIVKQTATDNYDDMRHNVDITGSDLHDVTGQLQIWLNEAVVFFPSINWINDRLNPNSITLPAEGSDILPIDLIPITQTGLLGAAVNDIPKVYNPTGDTLTGMVGQQATIHRLYNLGINSREFYLLYGQNQYLNAKEAKDNLQTDEESIVFPAEVGEMFFLGWVCVSDTATSFSDVDIAWLVSRLGSGGSGGSVAGVTDHTLLSNRDASDQHPTTAVTGLEGRLANLETLIVELTVSGYGSVSQDIDIPNFDLGAGWVILPFDTLDTPTQRGISFDIGAETFTFTTNGVWRFSGGFSLEGHNNSQQSRLTHIRFFNITQGTGSNEIPVSIARNAEDTTFNFTNLINVPNDTDVFRIEIGNGDVVTGGTLIGTSIAVNFVDNLSSI